MKSRRVLLLVIPVIAISCAPGNFFEPGSSTVSGTPVSGQNTWTILVFMNADNDLSSSAFADLNAMEAADLSGTGVVVLALVDLGAGGSVVTGAWQGARMYRVQHDSGGTSSFAIASLRLGWGSLGLTTTGLDEEIDTGDPTLLANFISYAKTNYPAQHYALVMWGHATGWRTVGTDSSSGNDSLYVQELGGAINGKGLDVVGFDTPTEGMLEVAWQIQTAARYMVASEGVAPVAGWDLQSLLSTFTGTGLAPLDFVTSAVSTFSTARAASTGACISAVDLTMLTPVMNALNNYSNALSSSITTSQIQTNVRQLIFGGVESYYNTPGDKDIDIVDMANVVKTTYGYAGIQADALVSAVQGAVVAEWHNTNGHPNSHGLALHYIPVDSNGAPLGIDPSYFRGTTSTSPLSFLATSTWAPVSTNGPGLEYRIWSEMIAP